MERIAEGWREVLRVAEDWRGVLRVGEGSWELLKGAAGHEGVSRRVTGPGLQRQYLEFVQRGLADNLGGLHHNPRHKFIAARGRQTACIRVVVASAIEDGAELHRSTEGQRLLTT